MKNRIKALRRARKWSQTELARRVGSAQTIVSKIESGKQPITDEMMAKIAAALAVHPVDLIDDAAWDKVPPTRLNEPLLRLISQAVLKAMRRYPDLPDDVAGAVTASLYRRYAPAPKGLQAKVVTAAAELLVEHELTKRD